MTTAAPPITLNYVSIPPEIAEEARRTMVDRFGHPLHSTSTIGPCRSCLRIPAEPEELILLSYQPLPDTRPYAEIGPIFIHARSCLRYSELETFPDDFASRTLVLRAYDEAGAIADACIAMPGEAPVAAARLLAHPIVTEVHVRHTTYTCFDFKIVRG